MSKVSQVTRLQELVYELEIAEVMTRDFLSVTPQMTMREFKEFLQEHRFSGAPVMEDGELVGIISIEDLIEALAAGELGCLVEAKMTRDPVVLKANDLVVRSVDYFGRFGYGRFPVVDDQGAIVGVLTKGDITRGLLRKLEVEYHQEEIRRARVNHIFDDVSSDHTSISLRYDVEARNFERGGRASRSIKRALKRFGLPRQIVRRAAIATYEAEMNVVIHADDPGGVITAEIQPDQIVIEAIDMGPGIPDIDLAMQRGFSTAPDWIREMGFGAGMGLKNIDRCADRMELLSPHGTRTTLRIVIYMDER